MPAADPSTVTAFYKRGLALGRAGAFFEAHEAFEAAAKLGMRFVFDPFLPAERWQTRDELRHAIVYWIERTYHRRRRQDRLGRLTPVEFEALLQTAHAA